MILICLLLNGCNQANDKKKLDNKIALSAIPTLKASQNSKMEKHSVLNEAIATEPVPSIKTVDYSDYFNEIEGCSVFYNSESDLYEMYNKELCGKRSSPYSTFKIISTLIGLESGVINSADSTMGYDGTFYSYDAWNDNLSLKDAFKESSVWYFRKVIDQVGQIEIQSWLDQLKYGNCNISEWDGSGINSLPQLNGFWLESSLEISPKEQVDVLENIFGGKTNFTKQNIEILKEVMLVQKDEDSSIYGKTGTGNKNNGWFVGMVNKWDKNYYFAVYLSDDSKETSGSKAKEIAINIIDKL